MMLCACNVQRVVKLDREGFFCCCLCGKIVPADFVVNRLYEPVSVKPHAG